MEQLKYDKINMEDNEFKKDSLERMKKMLTINRDGNIIYICHPNHLLNDFEINENKEITNVHYGDFSVERMFEVNDFGAFSIIEQLRDYSQFSYLHKRAKHMIKKYKEENKMNFKYPLVVLEETLEGNFYVRGIISCGQEGYSVTFNPNFNPQYEPECIFTKSLKYGKN